jgi:hypothetical protein
MTVTLDYFADKIRLRVHWYEDVTHRLDGRYIAQVEELAARTQDPALARRFRDTMNPARIAAELCEIRALLGEGEIVEADRSLGRLQIDLEFVESHLRHPYFTAGAKVKAGGKKGVEAKLMTHPPADPAAMRKMFEAKRRTGLKIGDAERAVARHYRVSTRTVRTARTGK